MTFRRLTWRDNGDDDDDDDGNVVTAARRRERGSSRRHRIIDIAVAAYALERVAMMIPFVKVPSFLLSRIRITVR